MFDDQPVNKTAGRAPANLPIADGDALDMFASVPEPQQDMQAQAPVAPSMPPAMASEPVQPQAPAAPSALAAGVLKPAGQAVSVAPADTALPPDPFAETAPASMQAPSAPQAPNPVPEPSFQSPAADTTVIPPFTPAAHLGAAVPPTAGGVPSQMPQHGHGHYALKEPTLSRGIMTTIIIVVVLLILGAGAWFIYGLLRTPANQVSDPLDSGFNDIGIEAEVEIQEIGSNGELEITDEDTVPAFGDADLLDDRIIFGEPVDSDSDGLVDEEEEARNTDPQNWDSDGDELNDGDEVLVWNTDPLNPDTDGDGYLDGQEIKAGYNPAGPGRFVDPTVVEEKAGEEPEVIPADPPQEDTTTTEAAEDVVEEDPIAPESSDDVGDLSSKIESHLSVISNTSCTPEDTDRLIRETADLFALQGYILPEGIAEEVSVIRNRGAWANDLPLYEAFLEEIVVQLAGCTA